MSDPRGSTGATSAGDRPDGRATIARAEDSSATDELEPETCWEILRSTTVGRVAVSDQGKPRIFPLNYIVDGETLVFRTASGTKLSALRHAAVEFEVDDYDAACGQATSVIVAGNAAEIEDPDEWDDALGLPLFPWHVDPKGHFIRITPTAISGRRFRAVYAGPDGYRKPTPS